MKNPLEMRTCRLKSSTERLAMEEAINFAKNNIDLREGWLLAQCPEEVIWQPLAKDIAARSLAHCSSLACFDSRLELRLQKSGEAYVARKLWLDETGEEGLERLTSYFLRDGKRLRYAEFFQPNEKSGILQLRLCRFCGVEK